MKPSSGCEITAAASPRRIWRRSLRPSAAPVSRTSPAPARPLVVLLDLNLPVLDGYEVFERIKEDERTRRIPVVVLTTTDDAAEVGRCCDLGCNAFITKPVEYQAFAETIHGLGLFLSVATMPEGE